MDSGLGVVEAQTKYTYSWQNKRQSWNIEMNQIFQFSGMDSI